MELTGAQESARGQAQTGPAQDRELPDEILTAADGKRVMAGWGGSKRVGEFDRSVKEFDCSSGRCLARLGSPLTSDKAAKPGGERLREACLGGCTAAPTAEIQVTEAG